MTTPRTRVLTPEEEAMFYEWYLIQRVGFQAEYERVALEIGSLSTGELVDDPRIFISFVDGRGGAKTAVAGCRRCGWRGGVWEARRHLCEEADC
jgi:hypothetical protein